MFRNDPTLDAGPAPAASIPSVSALSGPPRIAGLDGLRAIAIGAVLLFHADLYWARGGFLGVDLFFVISGFLITGLLADEIGRTGRLDLRGFYWRRAKRLLPAVWLMMAGVTVVAAVVAGDALPRLRGDSLASLAYLTNWELLGANVSYFEATGRPPLLQHLWSLAIEEQFYIAWALLVPLGLKLVGRRAMTVVAAVLALASATWMAVLAARMGYPGHGDPSRLYFGTDTHGFGLLLGSALGLAWQPARAARSIAAIPRAFGWLSGLAALALLGALFARMGEETTTLYPWGLLLTDAAALLLIATASHPGLGLGRWLDAGPMRWIGERSYGIYLWHWPVFMLTRPGIDLHSTDERAILALRLALTLGVAAMSYHYIEVPIRSGALERLCRDQRLAATQRSARIRLAALAMAVMLAVGTTAGTLWKAPTHAEPAADVRAALHLDALPSDRKETSAGLAPVTLADIAPPAKTTRRIRFVRPHAADPSSVKADTTATSDATATNDDADGPDDTMQADSTDTTAHADTTTTQADIPASIQPPAAPQVATYTGKDLTAVGDSVLLGSSQLLTVTLHDADVHAQVGWQAADILDQVQALQKAGSLRQAVLVHLGTNGYVTEEQLRHILTALKDSQRVVLVNTHVPRRWMEANNELIDRVAADYPNVVVARWNDVSEGEPDFFVSDGVHLTDRGQRAFIANVMRAGHLVPEADVAPAKAAIDPTRDYATGAGDASPTLVLAARSAPSDRYWQKLAQCETDANWRKPGAHAGGLAIAQEDWMAWGGAEFAKTPAEATPAQQIEVANRMSTQGWTQADGSVVKPIGFVRWRCVAALQPPEAHPGESADLVYTSDSVLAQTFHLGERGNVVRDLQILIGAQHDGIYSKATRRKHLSYLKKNGLPEERAGG